MRKIRQQKHTTFKNVALISMFIGGGLLSIAEPTPGINLGNSTSTAIGEGSLATGSGTTAVGANTFASGNNMSREEYERFLAENKAKLKEIETKMKEVASARGDLSKLEAEHQDIANKLRTIETYRNQIAEKERQLNEKEPILTKEIEVKKGEKVSYRTQIEDLERRLNIIGQLDFSTINDSNRGQAIDVLAQDLKTKMENGVTFLSEYGENGIPVEEYKNVIRKYISTDIEKINENKLNALTASVTEDDKTRLNLFSVVINSDIIRLSSKTKYTPSDHVKENTGYSGFLIRGYNYKYYNKNEMLSPIYLGYNKKLKKVSFFSKYSDPTNPNNKYDEYLNDDEHIYEYMLNTTVDDIDFSWRGTDGKYEKYNRQNNAPYNVYDNPFNNFRDSDKIDDHKFNPTLIEARDKLFKDIENDWNEYVTLKTLPLDQLDEVKALRKKQLENNFDMKMQEFESKYGSNITSKINDISKNNVYYSANIKGDVIIQNEYSTLLNPTYLAELKEQFNKRVEYLKEKGAELEKIEKINIGNSDITNKFRTEIDRLKALEKDTQDQITIKENEIAGYRSDITNLTNLLNSENPGNADEVARQINEKKELIANKEKEIATLKTNITNISDGENALANGTNSRALGKASISIGTNNYTNQESSIALGTNNTVNGEKSIAIGYGHNIQGSRNATLGDPNTIYGNDNFVLGNNITLGSEQNPVNNNLVFGSNINIQNVSNAIVLGNGSEAVENAVSVGKSGAERKIVNVADGLISETSKEAINGSQLYKFSLLLDDKLSKINLAPATPKVDTSLINADIANALAIAGIPQVNGNKLFSLGAGTGYNAGQAAIALGISGQTPNKMFIFKLSGAVNLKKGYSVSAGVNINFGDIEDTTNKKLEREVLELRNKLKDLKVPNVTEVNSKNYDGDITKLENQNKDLVKSNESLLNAIKYLKNELDSLKTQTDTLKKQTTTNKTNIAEQPVIQHIILDNFDFDKYDLKREHLSELGKLDYNTIKNVVIIGHADERGSDEYNQKLSENRAKIVRDFIKDLNNKIDIYYLGKGKSELISTDQAKNRRVEIIIK